MIDLSFEKIKELSKEYGDSFYVLDSDVFKDNCEKLLDSFKQYYEKTNLAYSYKTNYIPKLGKIINDNGGFAEVVSGMELSIAERIGVGPEMIFWNGPVKSKKEAERFLISGGTINVDSYSEFLTVCEIAKKHKNDIINIGVRCNYDIGDGVVSRFGLDVEKDEFNKIFEMILSIDNIELKSLQAHFANRNYKYWNEKAKGMISVYDKIVSTYGLRPSFLDLGGGISGDMPDSLREQLKLDRFSFDDYARRAATVFSEYFRDKKDIPWLIIEPGTAVAANCMRYVCKVETIKDIRGKIIITTNGSQKNISMSGINPPMQVVGCEGEKLNCDNADIAGYTCIESDYLYKNYCGKIGVGDYLVFGSCGSYSVVMKPPFIFPNVPVIDISSGKTELIKRAEKYEDIFTTYNF